MAVNAVKNVDGFTNYSLINGIYTCGVGQKFELNPTCLLVLIGLASHYNPDKSVVFPSQEYLAKNLNISERSVIRAIKELLAKNLIIKSKNGNNNVYCFTGIFFEAVRMSGSRCQNVRQKGDRMSGKHDNNIKYINNCQRFNKRVDEPGHLSVEKTREYLEEQKKVKIGSPLDLGFEESKEFLENLIPELQNSYFARELRKKWKL